VGRFERGAERAEAPGPRRETARGWYWLLLLPFFGTFFPWIYNTQDPKLFGIPFFYWYQMAWVPISVVLMVVVYRATTKRGVR
jgi:apolipoprotein N-acyltransferase